MAVDLSGACMAVRYLESLVPPISGLGRLAHCLPNNIFIDKSGFENLALRSKPASTLHLGT